MARANDSFHSAMAKSRMLPTRMMRPIPAGIRSVLVA